MREWLVDHLDRAFALIRDGALADTTDTVRVLTGREPRTFAAFARDHAGAFARVPAAVVTGSGGPTSSAARRA
jgi:hypothetical protein